MKKKVLIYYCENKLAPIGGPAGYLFNLQQELKGMQPDDLDIEFLPPMEENNTTHGFLKKYTPVRCQEFVRALKMTKTHLKKRSMDKAYLEYDVIHFHSTEDIYLCRDILEQYKGKVLLTSHTPCASFYEKMERLNKTDIKLFGKKLESLKDIDRYAFERADYVLFPCKEAEEPYYHTWDAYAGVRNKKKFCYIPSGIRPCHAQFSRERIREKYGIPQDAFVVSFVGRHNDIKGYADLKEIGKRLLDKNVWFLIAGSETPLKGVKHRHWIEAGWTKDPHSIINAADVFVLPNKETYFDLILLEVLSLGQLIVASNTGGNKYFKKYPEMGIMYYDTLQEAVSNIVRVRSLSKEEIQSYRKTNTDIFGKYFTTEVFTKNYITLLKEILNEEKYAD